MHNVIMPEKRMRNTGLFVIIMIVLFFILKQSFFLRSIGYDQIPDPYVILDEHTNVWHGLSIRKSGVPAAWSNLGAYKKGSGGDVTGLNLSVADYRTPDLAHFYNFPKPVYVLHPVYLGTGKTLKKVGFVQPYLDHPPVGALILSAFVNRDIGTFSDLLPADFRKGSLWLGVLTGLLIFILAWQISRNLFIGLISTAIYGSVPTYMLLSRYALLENVLSPIILTTLNILIFAKPILEKKSNRKYLFEILLVVAGIFCGFAALTKIVGWFMLIIGTFLLVFWQVKYRQILFFAIPAVLIGALYFVWGLYLDPQLFIDIFGYQSIDRGFVGSLNFLTAIKEIGIANFPFDGWWIGGFLSLLFIIYKKEYVPIIFSIVTILITTLILGGANYPWYYIPLIPFLCITTAIFIWKVMTEPSFISIMTFFLVFFSSSFFWGYGVFQADKLSTNYMQPYQLYRVLLLFFFLISLWFTFPAHLKYKKLSLNIWFIFMLFVVYQLWKWNGQSILFILSHWGKFPSLYTPGTF